MVGRFDGVLVVISGSEFVAMAGDGVVEIDTGWIGGVDGVGGNGI